ncbi:LysR family transcriptional regulator [Vibrio olivae]|uniref:LysR family transcriptional regulator n=1 Tax=Vibrio olivae TaxID=1243002 RepID=A0ABV5HJT7_9VIBR
MKIGLSELKAFRTIAEQGSLSAAARVLGVSPSALSHNLKNMEQTLNVRLFNRTTRSVSLTEAGEQFYRRIVPSMVDLQEAVSELSETQNNPSGIIRISSADSGSVPLIARFLPQFFVRYPDIKVEIVAESRFIDIVSEHFDAGIRLMESVPADMIAIKLTQPMRMIAVAAPAYFESHLTPDMPEQLKQHNCIRYRFDSGSLNLWELTDGEQSITIDVDGSLTLGNTNLMIEAALNGIGIAWVPEPQVIQYLDNAELVRVLPQWFTPLSELCLYYPANRFPRSVFRIFTQALREWVKQS